MSSTLFIVSDLHIGAGLRVGGQDNPLEDFLADAQFEAFLGSLTGGFRRTSELIVLGDAFDFPQVLPEIGKRCDGPRLGTTEAESLERMQAVIAGHPQAFDAMRQFLGAGGQLTFMRGNHDIDIFWPRVQTCLTARIACGGAAPAFEADDTLCRGGLWLEHGNQRSQENAMMHPKRPMVPNPGGVERLERCWGTYFMDEVYNDIETRFPVVDNVMPMLRGALLAVQSASIGFTGEQAAKLLMVCFKAGVPIFGWIGAGLLGTPHATAGTVGSRPRVLVSRPEDLIDNLADRQLADTLRRFRNEPTFRKAFDEAVAPLVKECSSSTLLQEPAENANRRMGFLTGKDAYVRAAETIFSNDSTIQLVVMGHTHVPVAPTCPDYSLNAPPGRMYLNSGSWTPSINLDDPMNQGLSMDELAISGRKKISLDYVQVDFLDDGRVAGRLLSAGDLG
jgi:UDP-2,3-diacylglucosamine pyrophosphatase LpxH